MNCYLGHCGPIANHRDQIRSGSLAGAGPGASLVGEGLKGEDERSRMRFSQGPGRSSGSEGRSRGSTGLPLSLKTLGLM